MTPLCKKAAAYGTDKLGIYTPFYNALFESIRGSVQKVLEIGIGTTEAMKHVTGYKPGASLRMWRDYFPGAEIVGIDIDLGVQFQDWRIRTYACDQSDPVQLLTVAQQERAFDLIVDDGSHEPKDQVRTAITLFPFLRVGGFYIIEDVNFPLDVISAMPAPAEFINTSCGGKCILMRREDVTFVV